MAYLFNTCFRIFYFYVFVKFLNNYWYEYYLFNQNMDKKYFKNIFIFIILIILLYKKFYYYFILKKKYIYIYYYIWILLSRSLVYFSFYENYLTNFRLILVCVNTWSFQFVLRGHWHLYFLFTSNIMKNTSYASVFICYA